MLSLWCTFLTFILLVLHHHWFLATDKLPPGAYCSFSQESLEACGWKNTDPVHESTTLNPSTSYRPDHMPRWIRRTTRDGETFATVNFSQGHTFPDRAVLRSQDLDPIPYYHSLNESLFYKTCLVSYPLFIFSWQLFDSCCLSSGMCGLRKDLWHLLSYPLTYIPICFLSCCSYYLLFLLFSFVHVRHYL